MINLSEQNVETTVFIAFAAVLIACLGLLAADWIRRYMDRNVIIDEDTPGAFMRRPDVANEWEDES